MLTFHQVGCYPPGRVRVEWCQSARRLVPEVEATIERAWREAMSAGSGATSDAPINLYDGPICRLESWRAEGGGGESSQGAALHLRLSLTTYKAFYGTHLTHAHLADRFGRDVMSNPLGASTALLSADGHALLGRRNANVAYYPGRLHPFAGSLEPPGGDGHSPEALSSYDVFDEMRRELREEVGLMPGDLSEIVCTGIIEDRSLRHPELVFAARAKLSRDQLVAQLSDHEHHGAWSVPAEPEAVSRELRGAAAFTPVARGALLLWGRLAFGEDWFNPLAAEVS